MNYAESFQDFSSQITPTSLMIYAGAALVVFVLLKDQLAPVKNWLLNTYQTILSSFNKSNSISRSVNPNFTLSDNDFLKLVSSWKNTRDLAEKLGCSEAVKILDSAFAHLGPNNCSTSDGE